MTSEQAPRRKPVGSVGLAAVAVIGFFVAYSMASAPTVTRGNTTYISGLTWHTTSDQGIEEARAQNKPIFLYFWAIWCTFCEKLHAEVFPDPEVSRMLLNDYVRVAVDLDVNREDARRFNVAYPPHIILMTPGGEAYRHIGGYIPAAEMRAVLAIPVPGNVTGGPVLVPGEHSGEHSNVR